MENSLSSLLSKWIEIQKETEILNLSTLYFHLGALWMGIVIIIDKWEEINHDGDLMEWPAIINEMFR